MADESKESSNSNLAAACFRCRGFRHACDRRRPACSRCQRRGIDCTYPEAAPTLKKLQKATETLGDKIRKFGDRLKSGEGTRNISLQRLAQQARTSPGIPVSPGESVATPGASEDTRSLASFMSDTTEEDDMNYDEDDADSMSSSSQSRHRRRSARRVASTNNFSVYPCSKCFKDLQQCDLTRPRCSRCEANHFDCVYTKTQPKANHVSQVLMTMNKVVDQWQESIDKMAKDFAQKTRDLGIRANNSLKMKPMPPFAWKITSTNKGLSVESSVNSFNDLSTLVEQFKRSMTISSRTAPESPQKERSPSLMTDEPIELDDASSIHTSSTFSFAIWNSWAHPTHALPQDYPIDISQELTDNLIELYCRTPCCSVIRLPIVDTVELLARYRDPDKTKRPSKVLIYAICAMAARNAFQLHVWSKRPSFEAPQYNMGKALSMAYCLRGRELLAECFDKPSLDNCQAAFLLSYCNHQNGYPGVIYIYEWIAFTMAQELGLYDSGRVLTYQENMLVWCLYYFNTWYRVLQGDSDRSLESSLFFPSSPLPSPLPVPSPLPLTNPPASMSHPLSQKIIDYYVSTVWSYLIQLQILRSDVMARLVAARTAGKPDTTLPQDLLVMQQKLQQFYDTWPEEWRQQRHAQPGVTPPTPNNTGSPSSTSSGLSSSPMSSPSCSHSYCRDDDRRHYCVDIPAFARFCVLYVHMYYNINRILLYQPFFSSDRFPSTQFSLHCLHVCMEAANSITVTLEEMTKQRDDCHIPLLGFVFANIIYMKMINYEDERYQSFARQGLQQSIDISKSSTTYMYDFEMSKSMVSVMERDVQEAYLHKTNQMAVDPPASVASHASQ
ncbi:uncharacterized protein BYT42DRAFT_573517 [Radiomyces spectabilis]|uniref:uncharacterized protein n=1 Tax=Radiomyces spectabilis TaxID=64574 RepID=UPI002220960C|nr:uncharacterized protein BYT42DRAFT_573517 [Radiomyces spectabilis]KAI8376127.1 hypothetical protein BYT42DRAFT_573517 [Radiomyces spectabilis]